MRFLGVGYSLDLGSLYLRLIEEGHEVKAAVTEPLAAGTLAGLVPHVSDWRDELGWVRDAGQDGIILFESVAEGSGTTQDALRRDGYRVVGGCAWGDRIENDRAYAQAVLAEDGFQVAPTWEFDDAAAADVFIRKNPARYVLKFNGPNFSSGENHVGLFDDGRDVRAVLAAKAAEYAGQPISFILMQHIDGIEMGVGAYFNGRHFLTPACIDWEHKRFFAGDMGELTGEMGTVATFDQSGRFFGRTLAKLEPRLREAGYVGYINLNTIVNADGIWPLEFTCRFGYPGYATLEPLQESSWAELFQMMVSGTDGPFRTRPGFSVALVLTTPPFPYTRHHVAAPVGIPVFFSEDLSDADRRNLHFGEVGLRDGELVTSGLYGWTMVATGTGPTIVAAKDRAYALAAKVLIPNMRYRLDIGDRLIGGDWARLGELGLLGD
jgi:phosphoribosylamine---glycine ligase